MFRFVSDGLGARVFFLSGRKSGRKLTILGRVTLRPRPEICGLPQSEVRLVQYPRSSTLNLPRPLVAGCGAAYGATALLGRRARSRQKERAARASSSLVE